MTKKELSQLYYLNREIERDKLRLLELETASGVGAQKITGMPSCKGVFDKIGDYAAEIADLRGIIEANIQRCWYELNKLNRYIASVEDSQMRQILALRFINCLEWQSVADCIGGNNTEDSVKKAFYRFLKRQ